MFKKIRIAAGVVCCCFSFASSAQAALICGDFVPCPPVLSSSVYTVQPGDTLWGIAHAHETTPTALAFANQMALDSPLQIGQSLELPASGTTSYAVQYGDTLWSLAQRYGTTCQELLQYNPTLSAECLQTGQKIILPASAVREIPAVSVSRQRPAQTFFAWPLTGIITSPFGNRSLGGHHGIDIAGETGDTVRAAASGTVLKAEFHEIYGNMILIEHANGQQTLYGHLSRMDVQPGAQVGQGQKIGAVGNTGRSTGPHLHFEIRIHEIAVNPMPYLPR